MNSDKEENIQLCRLPFWKEKLFVKFCIGICTDGELLIRIAKGFLAFVKQGIQILRLLNFALLIEKL